MALDKLSKAEEKLLNDQLIVKEKGSTLSVLDQDNFAKDATNDGAQPEQKKVELDETTGPLPAADNFADDHAGQPELNAAQNSAQSGNQRATANKQPLNAVEEFENARGELWTPEKPSVARVFDLSPPADNSIEAEEDILKDISVAAMTGAQIAMTSRKASGELNEETGSRRYGYDSDGRNYKESAASTLFATQDDWQREVDQNREYMGTLRTQIADNDRQILKLRQVNEAIDKEIAPLTEQRDAAAAERDALVNKANVAYESMRDAEMALPEASARLESKIKEKYPDGKIPAMGEPDPVRDSEEKMRKESFDKHRGELLSYYKEKGLEKEFLIMEKVGNGEQQDPREVETAIGKMQAANAPYDPNIKLAEIAGPDEDYSKTLDAAKRGVMGASAKIVETQAHFAETQSKEAKEKIQELDNKLKDIDEKLTTLKAEKNKNEEAIKLLEKDNIEAKSKLAKAQEYDAWLNSPETKAKIANNQLTHQDFKDHAPEGWIDDGVSCKPSTAAATTESKAPEAPAANDAQTAPASNPQATSRTATSATDSGIGKNAPQAAENFNAAASPDPNTPVPQAPVPNVQKPAPAAAPAM